MNHNRIITIDGPAGSGKSTIARALARKLNIAYLDTGAMYRAATLAALEQNADLTDDDQITQITKKCSITMEPAEPNDRIFLNGRDVTTAIRSVEVTNNAHYLAAAPSVRAVMVTLQQQIGQKNHALVTEGRDQGTVVFPHASFKFYLDASPQVRARRRWLQLKQKDPTITLNQVLDDQNQRDHRDKSRTVGPLTIPNGAHVIDTSELTVEQVIDRLYSIVSQSQS